MRIRIQEASRNAYPCGSGSETLILYYRRVDKRAITVGYFVQLLFDSWCRLKEKQKREREAQVVKQRREERRGTPGTPPARGKKRTERPAEETNSSIVKVTQNIVSRISLVEMVLIWSTPSFLLLVNSELFTSFWSVFRIRNRIRIQGSSGSGFGIPIWIQGLKNK